MTTNFVDSLVMDADSTKMVAGGFMVAVAKSVRTGVQDYLGTELGKPEMNVVRVYRPASEVFSDASLRSFSHAPITDDHPAVMVDSSNWKDLAKGEVSTAAKKDGDWITLPLLFKDQAVIDKVKNGKRGLSAGYTCDLEWTSGMTEDGTKYDAIQRNIKINHLALVDMGRAGSEARVQMDSKPWGVAPFTPDRASTGGGHMTVQLAKVIVDGLTIETTDQGVQVIQKLQSQLTDANAAFEKMKKEKEEDVKKKDAELGAKDAEILALKSKVLDTKALDAAVAARSQVVDKARAMMPDVKVDGVSDADIRRAVVAHKVGASVVDGKPDDYVLGFFDNLSREIQDHQGIRHALSNPAPAASTVTGQKAQDAAYAASVASLNSWRK
jgi:uncharacterized protein